MADAPATASKGGSGLTRKVGPLPVWGWAAIGFGVYWWFTHYGPGAKSAATAQAQQPGVTIGNIRQTLIGGRDRDGRGGGPGPGPLPGRTVTVPHVVGMTDTAADAAIRGAGLKVRDVNERKGGSGGGTKVTGQSPAAGTKVARGSTVSITLGKAERGGDRATTRGAGTTIQTGGPPPRKPRKGQAGTSRTAASGGEGTGGSQTVIVVPPAPTGGPVNAETGAPVFEEWQHAHRGPQVPPPVEAYAPGTNGAVYGPAAVDVASQSLG